MASHLIHSEVQGHNTRPGGLYDLHPPLATHRTPSALPVIFPVAQAMVIPLTFWESLKHSTHAPAPGSLHLLLPFACSAFPWVFVYLHARSLSLSQVSAPVSQRRLSTPHYPPPLSKFHCWDFPGGTVCKNPPANAGGCGFDPWSRKIPHAAEQLSPGARTPGPTSCSY